MFNSYGRTQASSSTRHKERFMKFKFPYAAISILAMVCALPAARPQSAHAQMQLRGVGADSAVTRYRTTKIEGLDIFYREAGPADAPAVLLLHGFPTSSHMFRNLIPALADRYHLIAPDYPGFGQSGTPDCLRRRVSLPPRVHHRIDVRIGRVLGGRRSQEIAPRATQEGATVTASHLAEDQHGKLRSLS